MKLVHRNWYGFIHEKVAEMLKSDVRYMCDMTLDGERFPVAVYYNENPDRSKNHKNFVLLCVVRDGLGDSNVCIRGKDLGEFSDKERYQTGVHCEDCGEVIYSCQVHHYNECHCKENFVDGGKDYVRSSASQLVRIDLLTGKIV